MERRTGIWRGCLSPSAITFMKWMGSCAKWHGYPFILKDRWSQGHYSEYGSRGCDYSICLDICGTYCDGCIGIIALSTCYKFRALRSRVVQGELELQWCQGTLRRVILTTLARISHGDVTNRRVY